MGPPSRSLAPIRATPIRDPAVTVLAPPCRAAPSSVPRRPCRLARRPPCRPLPPCRRTAAPTVPRPVPFVPPSDALPAVCCRRAALPPTLAVPRRLYTHTFPPARLSLR